MGTIKTLAERIWPKVNKTDTCWIWNGAIDQKGYGRVNHYYTSLKAHRAVYELLVGPIPDGLVLDHLCRNRACVNPLHLEPVTQAENTARGIREIKTECKYGHEYTPENTQMDRGSRRCRTCRNEQRKKREMAS